MTTLPPPIEGLSPSAPRSKWPTIVGVLAIIFGSYGILEHLCGLGTVLAIGPLVDWIAGFAPPEDASHLAAFRQATTQYAIPTVLLNAFLLANAVLLLVAGIGCARRQGAVRPKMLLYAAVEVFLSVVSAVLAFQVAETVADVMREVDGAGGVPAQFSTAINAGEAVMGLLFAAIWPVFLLVWFTRRSVVEEVGAWAAVPRDPWDRG